MMLLGSKDSKTKSPTKGLCLKWAWLTEGARCWIIIEMLAHHASICFNNSVITLDHQNGKLKAAILI